MTRRRSDLSVLHLLNAVFAPLTGRDLYLAEQIKAGIDTALADRPEAERSSAVADAINRLRGVLEVSPGDGFFHWDARSAPGSLFARQQVVEGLKGLAPFQNATLLVTNLRDALCPAGKRWTSRRRGDYDEAVEFISTLAASRKRTNANLSVLFL
ncbi:MAG TPA: hypothetical protein VMM36_18405 [Opitutaceae bacterium]|nr:hypothetical protein [Opitutaceae bacterium]